MIEKSACSCAEMSSEWKLLAKAYYPRMLRTIGQRAPIAAKRKNGAPDTKSRTQRKEEQSLASDSV